MTTALAEEIARVYGTPGVVIDLDKVEANIARLQAACDAAGVANRPHIKTHKSPELARLQIAAGARGYLLKKIDADFLLSAIRRAVDGDNVLSPEMTAKLVQRLRAPAASSQAPEYESLTPRERETLSWLAQGASNKQIAREMDVAESTIKVHVQNILRKLNLHSRVQAAVYAVENGFDKLDRD